MFERLVGTAPVELVLRRLQRDGYLLTTKNRRSLYKQVLVKGLDDDRRPYACIREAFLVG